MKKNLLAVFTSVLMVVIFVFSLAACDQTPTTKICTVTAVYDSSKGSVTVKDSGGEEKSEFTSGDTAVVEVAANDGYKVASFKAGAIEKGLVDGKYTFTVTADTQISVEFTSLYKVTATYNEAHGKVEICDARGNEKEWFDNSESVYVKVTPADGYTLTGFSRNGVSYTYKEGYSFTVNGTDAEIRAEFYSTAYLPLANALKTMRGGNYTVNITYSEYEAYDVFVTEAAVYSGAAGDGGIEILDFFDDDIIIDDGSGDTSDYSGYYADKNNVYSFATVDGNMTKLGLVPEKMKNLHASFAEGEDLLSLFDCKEEGVYTLKAGLDVSETLNKYFKECDEGNYNFDYLADKFTGLTLTVADGKVASVTVPYGESGEGIVFTYSDVGTTECSLDFVNIDYIWTGELGTYTDGTTTVVIDREGVKYNGEYIESFYSSWGLELTMGETVNKYIGIDDEQVYLRVSNLELYLIIDESGMGDVAVKSRLIYTADEKGEIPNSFVGIWEGEGITSFDPASGGFVGTHYRLEVSGTVNEVNTVYVTVDGGEKVLVTVTDYVDNHLYVKDSAESGYNFWLTDDGSLMFIKYGGNLGLMLDNGTLVKEQPQSAEK